MFAGARSQWGNDRCSCSPDVGHAPPRQGSRYHVNPLPQARLRRPPSPPTRCLRPPHRRIPRRHRRPIRHTGTGRPRRTPRQAPRQTVSEAMPHWRRPTSCISWCPAVAATACPPRPSRGRPRRVPGASPRPGSEAGRCWRCTDSDDAGRCHSWAEAQLSQRRHGWLRPSRCESSPTSECASAPGMASATPTNPCMRPSSRCRQNRTRPGRPPPDAPDRLDLPTTGEPIRVGELHIADLAIGLAGGTVLLLDGRSPEDVAHGHIPGSWPVAIGTLPAGSVIPTTRCTPACVTGHLPSRRSPSSPVAQRASTLR